LAAGSQSSRQAAEWGQAGIASQAGRRPSGGQAGSHSGRRTAECLASRQLISQAGGRVAGKQEAIQSSKQAAEWWASR
jgi:hypothetical protein